MKILFRWLINALALLAITQLLEGFTVDNLYHALMIALVLGFINALIRPVLLLLTLPINILTLGLFTFVINALLIWFVSTFMQGFQVDGFLTAVAAAIVLWIVSTITNRLIKQSNELSNI